jgi:hypothetical protein
MLSAAKHPYRRRNFPQTRPHSHVNQRPESPLTEEVIISVSLSNHPRKKQKGRLAAALA